MEFASEKDKTLIIWEPFSVYELSNIDKKYLVEFKFPETVFKLLDAFYPGNFSNFHKILTKLSKRMSDYLVFYLLVKRVHQLLVLKFSGSLKLPFWQVRKLKDQSTRWNSDKLLKALEGLYKIDAKIKTSSTPFSLFDSLDILASFVL